jgi:hypothetical protein
MMLRLHGNIGLYDKLALHFQRFMKKPILPEAFDLPRLDSA